MKVTRRALAIVLCVATLLTTMVSATDTTGAAHNLAVTEAEVSTFPQTYEAAMPVVPMTRGVSNTTLSVPARQEWVKDTTLILENTYHQEVASVYETDSTVVFEFADPPEEYQEYGLSYIMKEEYLKPEAQTRAGSNATKISYVYGFGEGMYRDGAFDVDSQSGKWSVIKDVLITVVGLNQKCSVAAAVLSLFGISINYFSDSQVVEIENLAQYYFLNKVGMVKDTMTGMWVPLAYVGMRKDFRNFYIFENINGYLLHVDEDITVPNNFVNPTNADKTQTKSNFYNDNWIMQKALTIYENDDRTYYDVYAIIGGFFADTYPSG